MCVVLVGVGMGGWNLGDNNKGLGTEEKIARTHVEANPDICVG